MFKKVLSFLLMLSFVSVVNAGTVGKVVGVITDAQTGEPLPGVNIVLTDTYLGATTDINGYFSILNVPVGTYNLKISYMGYKEVVVTGIRVHADLTTTHHQQIEPTVMELGEAISIIAERPIIKKDETNTIVIKTSEEIKEMAVRGVQNIASLQAGVVKAENSGVLNIRGGRGNETAYIVDGVVQNNPLRGGMAATVNNNSIEELQLQTGGFNAEYGRIMSGMVNITTKTGGRDYHFLMEGITDMFTVDAIGAESYGYNDVNATVSGPILPGSGMLTFYLAAQRQYLEDRNPSWIQRDWDEKYTDGDVIKPNNDLGAWNFNGKLLFQPMNNLKFTLSGLYSANDYNTYFHTYSLGNEAHNTHQEDYTNSWNLTTTYTMGQNTYFDWKLNYFDHEYKSGDGVFFEDTEKYGSKAYNPDISAWGQVTTTLLYPDFYEIDHVNNFFTKERTSYMGTSFDLVHQLNKNNTFKVGFSYEYHTLRFYETRPAAWWQGATDEGVIVDADGNAVSVIGADVPASDYDFWVTRHRALSHSYNFGYDAWGNETDEDMFSRSDLNDYFSNKLQDNAKRPIMASAYIQDKVEFEDIILNLGLRMDYLNSNDWVFKNMDSPFGDDKIFDSGDIEESKAHMFLMPRLGFSFPVSNSTVFHAQYGVFYQMPNLIDLYNGRMYLENLMIESPWYDSIGNPNLEPEKTTSYEVGFKQQVGEYLGVNINVFYKETEGLIQQVSFDNDITSLGTFINGDFGSVKGVDFMATLRRTNHVSASVNYTLSYAKGTGSASGTLRNIAWLQGEVPTVASPLDFDQRHTGSVAIDYRFADDEGPTVFGMKPLQNFGVNLIGSFNSGRPYTLIRLTGNEPYAGGGTSTQPQTAVNATYSGWNNRLDLKIDKTFKLPFFGLRTNAFIWVLNVLDTENIRGVWETTGKPDNNGYADSEAGQLALESLKTTDPDVYDRYYYRGLHPNNWGIPRMIRFGLRLEL